MRKPNGLQHGQIRRRIPIRMTLRHVEMMLRGGPSHDNGHIDQIEAALK